MDSTPLRTVDFHTFQTRKLGLLKGLMESGIVTGVILGHDLIGGLGFDSIYDVED